ncbi:anthranilate phosphoribosyltransferase [Methylacidimicrobium cyclopophantes]|uniref:Anthranilate phosphoribosyltransferase n=1 Tax=Methylacidimicrobium cyclopophantes TaxID=1041766 RepID=A0A5E6MJZ7_9BACT|nr:anthranilate phosphoribosyltransferase [Methylacidimicrobium cyclopophantes]VVM08425.1 anthranilate phosphoribosyltransferase [Methylacidimicrobium cyclopophantes]
MKPSELKTLCGRPLEKEEAERAVALLLDERISEEEKAAFLVDVEERGATGRETAYFAEAFRRRSVPVGLRGYWEGRPILDCCGTGGGGLNLCNISTGTMFILAAAGVPVVKHGNRGVSKVSGSGDVLEAMGIPIRLSPAAAERSLRELGMVYLHAPDYHPAFATLGPLRRRLASQGRKTIFHLLGPLLNPARPAVQIVGVFLRRHLPLFEEALLLGGCRRPVVVFGTDAEGRAIGELGVEGEAEIRGLDLPEAKMVLAEFARRRGYAGAPLEEALVDSARESAVRLRAVFSGREKGLVRGLLAANAAVGLVAGERLTSLAEALEMVEELLDRGVVEEKVLLAERLASELRLASASWALS